MASLMTRRHFKVIAKTLRRLRQGYRRAADQEFLDSVEEYFVRELSFTNSRFSRDKFLTACQTGKGL